MGVRGLTLPFYSTRLGLRAGLHYWRCRMHVSSPAGRLKTSRREFCGGSGVSARPPTDSSLATPRVKKHSGRISNDEGQLASSSPALIAQLRTALVCFFGGDVFQLKCVLGWKGLTIVIVVLVFKILWTQIRPEIAQFWRNHFLSYLGS